MRRYILDNVRMWFEDFHVDALRLDAVHALSDTSEVHLLEEMAIETAALSRASAQLAHHRVNHVFGHDGIRRHPLERTFGDQHRAAA